MTIEISRLDDRVLASVPPMSKEERRREFAARAAHQEQLRRAQASLSSTTVLADPNALRGALLTPTGHWTPNHDQIQVYFLRQTDTAFWF